MVITLYIWNEWRYDTFHKKINSIYRITEKQDQAGTLYNIAVTPGPLSVALQKDFPEIERTVRFSASDGILKNGANVYEEKNIQLTDSSIFDVFDFTLIKGDPQKALNDPHNIVITETTADRYFGNGWRSNPAVLGQVFRMNDKMDFKLTGIVRDPPANSSIQFDILLPLNYLFTTDEFSNKWGNNNYHTYVQLKPGSDPEKFQQKIERRLGFYNTGDKDLLMLQPLKKQYLYSSFDFRTDWGKRSDIIYIKIFMAIGLLLLIIACVNFINLSTARSLKRSMEVGIRKVHGASRSQLVVQFLIESVLMALIAGIFAVFIIIMLQPLLKKITGVDIDIRLSQPVFAASVVSFILIAGLLAGAYPAFVLSAFRPVTVLKKKADGRSGSTFRKGLVITQFTISAALMIFTFFMYRQFEFIRHKDLGFNKDRLLSIRLGGDLSERSGLFQNDVDRIAGVTASSPATTTMVNVQNSTYMEWEGMQQNDKFLVTQANIAPGFIPALGLTLVSGSNFSGQRLTDTANYIINQAAAARMGYTIKSAIGKQVNFWGGKGAIIGVVKDFNFKPLHSGIQPFIFRFRPKESYYNLFVKVLPGEASQVIAQAAEIYKKYETNVPFQFAFVSDVIDHSYSEEDRTARIILFFTCLTVFVGCLGLFGLSVFSAEQRIKEIGIRKVLGASITSIVSLLSRDFLKLVMISILIAVPVALYMTSKWLDTYAYRIRIDWWVFASAAVVVICVALATVGFQAVKSGFANPVKALNRD